jgi:hypothetical protein
LIRFPCKCAHEFNLTEDQAGGLVQCPRCGLLVDVPTLSDLAHLNPDGTFGFGVANTPVDRTTAADLHRVFTNKTTDRHGNEKDLRNSVEQYDVVGVGEDPPRRATPRYDPVTGELIRPLQFKEETPVPVLAIATEVDPSELTPEEREAIAAVPAIPVIPIAQPAKPPVKSLAYATGDTRKQVTAKTLALELLMPANSVVMIFGFVLYLAAYMTSHVVAKFAEQYLGAAVVWPFLIMNLPLWLVLAHACCVIEETGPDAVDELPRPLRNFELGDDVFTPLWRSMLAIVICFVPAILLYSFLDPRNPMTLPIVLCFGSLGAFCFPAVLLTAITGTTVLNLRPDRVIAVIKQCGTSYFASVILFLLAAIPSTYYLAGDLLFRLSFDSRFNRFFERAHAPIILLPMLLAGVYLLHFFCWHLGMLYRANHATFPWLAQRHIKTERPPRRGVGTAR